MKRIIHMALIIAMLITCVFNKKAYGAQNVTVKLPVFPVTLNGILTDNRNSRYPLLIYKDITYFPMTYYDCRSLGVESVWNEKTGLTVVSSGINWGYRSYGADKPNYNTYTARVAPFKINVNGKNIDNSKEEYPLLLFRNITYLPLTWRFAVEEFGWNYSFDNSKGLVINSRKSGTAGQLTLPIVTRENGEKGAFTLAGDCFYYEGPEGIIYQAQISAPDNKKKVYQLPEAGYGSKYVYASLKTENGKALLSYHTGGVTMGSDNLILLKEDGTFEKLDSGYSVMKIYDDYQIRVNQSVPPAENNLQIRKSGESDYRSVGSPDYLYGWIWGYDKGVKYKSGKRSEDLYLINDEIYVLGCYGKDNPDSGTGIYKVNINTDVTERVCAEPASSFKIVDSMIYFTGLNDSLYKVPIWGGKPEKLTDGPVGHYNILNGMIFYSLKDRADQLYIHGNKDSVNPGGKLKSLEIQNGYMVAVFDKESTSQFKMMIIDGSGKIIYKTIENVLLVRIENGKVVYVKDN